MPDRPNVLIIYPDQMRYDVMGCAGNGVVRTPNMDALAAGGVRFERAYVSFPLCCPFRASVMTGKYAHANGMFANHYPIDIDQTFLAECFRDAGYRTGYVGKWHLDGGGKHVFVPPERRLGFEWFVGFNRGHQYLRPMFYRNDDPRPRTSRRFEPEAQTDHLLEFLDDCRTNTPERPFLAMIAYGPPHPPLVMPEHYATMYAEDEVPIRASTPDAAASQARARKFLARYYGLTTAVDDCVGRVLAYLEDAGLAANTIVYLVSDHGEMAGEFGRFGKRSYHEASMRVPLVVRWPAGLPSGAVSGQLVDPAVDTMPTLLSLCRIDAPAEVQGVDFAPLLGGNDAPVRDAVYYEIIKETRGPEGFPIPERGVRTPEWLYVRTEDAPLGLYDLRSDPLEMNDLSASADHADVARRLDAMLTDHMTRTGDDWSLEADFPPPEFVTHERGREIYLETLPDAILEP